MATLLMSPKECSMKHFYSEIKGVTLTFSDIQEDGGLGTMRFRFDRDHDDRDSDFAEGCIPQFVFDKAFGFSEAELRDMMHYVRNNVLLMWQLAQEAK